MTLKFLVESELTGEIIAAFFEVYNVLGYGFLEHVYAAALEQELYDRGHNVARELPVPIFYKERPICTYRLDMLVDSRVIIEAKAGVIIAKNSLRQLDNYLKATGIEVRLLLHFGPEPKVYRQQLSTRKGVIDVHSQSSCVVTPKP